MSGIAPAASRVRNIPPWNGFSQPAAKLDEEACRSRGIRIAGFRNYAQTVADREQLVRKSLEAATAQGLPLDQAETGYAATIGLHGHRHLCASRARSLVPLQEASEFAGVPAAIQRLWIDDGLRMRRKQDLSARYELLRVMD